MALLPWLATHLPAAVPIPTFVGRASETYPWNFAGYPMLPGQSIPDADLSFEARVRLAAPFGRFLRALHGVDVAAARRLGAGSDTLDRLNVASRREATRQRLALLVEVRALADPARVEQVLDEAPTLAPAGAVLVHGDLHAGQILVDHGYALSGVIDWGDLHVGDPAVDLAAAQAVLPAAAHAAFRSAYGAIDEVSWAAARARAVWHTVALFASAVDQDNRALAREARAALERLVNP